MRVSDSDHGYKRVLRELGAMNTAIAVGVWSAEGHGGSNRSVLEIAGYLHFGTSRGIPERPFIANWFDAYELRNRAQVVVEAKRVAAGLQTVDRMLGRLAESFVGQAKKNIAEGGSPPFAPNTPATIARKGSSKPLINTGQLRSSITSRIERGS